MPITDNFAPTVKCPHCNKSIVVTISGFGREGLNTRFKTCKYCNKDFTVELLVVTSLEPKGVTAELSVLNSRLMIERKKLKDEINIKNLKVKELLTCRKNLSEELKIISENTEYLINNTAGEA